MKTSPNIINKTMFWLNTLHVYKCWKYPSNTQKKCNFTIAFFYYKSIRSNAIEQHILRSYQFIKYIKLLSCHLTALVRHKRQIHTYTHHQKQHTTEYWQNRHISEARKLYKGQYTSCCTTGNKIKYKILTTKTSYTSCTYKTITTAQQKKILR